MWAFFSKPPLPVPPFQQVSHCPDMVGLHVWLPTSFSSSRSGDRDSGLAHASLRPQHLSWLYGGH